MNATIRSSAIRRLAILALLALACLSLCAPRPAAAECVHLHAAQDMMAEGWNPMPHALQKEGQGVHVDAQTTAETLYLSHESFAIEGIEAQPQLDQNNNHITSWLLIRSATSAVERVTRLSQAISVYLKPDHAGKFQTLWYPKGCAA